MRTQLCELRFFALCFLLLSLLTKYSEQCAATSPGTSPTVAPVVTTTVAATGCKSCTLAQITTIQSATFDRAFTSDTIDSSGTCSTRTVVCTARVATSEVSIGINQSGLSPTVGSRTATFTCNDQGQWVYTQGADSAVVTTMECRPIETP